MNDIEIIKMLLDIEESMNKNETIRNKIREILDGMGEQPPTAVMTQDSIKIGPPALTDSITPAATKPPKDEPQKLLRSKEVIGKTNRGGGEEYIRHREADGTAFGGMVHKSDRGRDGMHRADD